jgi:hypothetical protein
MAQGSLSNFVLHTQPVQVRRQASAKSVPLQSLTFEGGADHMGG